MFHRLNRINIIIIIIINNIKLNLPQTNLSLINLATEFTRLFPGVSPPKDKHRFSSWQRAWLIYCCRDKSAVCGERAGLRPVKWPPAQGVFRSPARPDTVSGGRGGWKPPGGRDRCYREVVSVSPQRDNGDKWAWEKSGGKKRQTLEPPLALCFSIVAERLLWQERAFDFFRNGTKRRFSRLMTALTARPLLNSEPVSRSVSRGTHSQKGLILRERPN